MILTLRQGLMGDPLRMDCDSFALSFSKADRISNSIIGTRFSYHRSYNQPYANCHDSVLRQERPEVY